MRWGGGDRDRKRQRKTGRDREKHVEREKIHWDWNKYRIIFRQRVTLLGNTPSFVWFLLYMVFYLGVLHLCFWGRLAYNLFPLFCLALCLWNSLPQKHIAVVLFLCCIVFHSMTISQVIYSTVGKHLCWSQFVGVANNSAINILARIFLVQVIKTFLLDTYQGIELLGDRACIYLAFEDTVSYPSSVSALSFKISYFKQSTFIYS